MLTFSGPRSIDVAVSVAMDLAFLWIMVTLIACGNLWQPILIDLIAAGTLKPKGSESFRQQRYVGPAFRPQVLWIACGKHA